MNANKKPALTCEFDPVKLHQLISDELSTPFEVRVARHLCESGISYTETNELLYGQQFKDLPMPILLKNNERKKRYSFRNYLREVKCYQKFRLKN